VISLYYYEELTIEEIGQVMNLTKERVETIHQTALARLKILLEEEDIHEYIENLKNNEMEGNMS